jgi:hypothetical protein
MITSHYINEGATLVLNAGGHPHYIPVTDDTREFCESAFRESNHPTSRCKKCQSWIPIEQEELVCQACAEEEGPSDNAMQESASQYHFIENERYRKNMTDAGRGHLLP